MSKDKKEKIVLVSGGFDPLHVGHIRHFKAAKELGDKLIVLINNDNWLNLKKGHIFMPEKERKEVIKAIQWVDEVLLTSHEPGTEDISIVEDLKKIRPDIYAKGGDRTYDNIPEVPVCEEMGCEMIFDVGEGGKIQSSSWLLEMHRKKSPTDDK